MNWAFRLLHEDQPVIIKLRPPWGQKCPGTFGSVCVSVYVCVSKTALVAQGEAPEESHRCKLLEAKAPSGGGGSQKQNVSSSLLPCVSSSQLPKSDNSSPRALGFTVSLPKFTSFLEPQTLFGNRITADVTS